MKIYRIIIIMMAIAMLGGCRGQIFSENSWFAPFPAGIGKPPESAPENYKAGWYDGCHTGLSTMNEQYFKMFYGYKQDYTKVDDEVYYQAWKDAYTYCRQSSFRYTWDAYDRYRNGSGGILTVTPLCVICENEQSR